MSAGWQIALTSISTILGGIIVYTVGRLLEHLFVEPIINLRGLIGEAGNELVFYANVYCNPGYCTKDKCDETSNNLRHKASQLRVRAYAIPWYDLWACMRLIPKKKNIEEASKELIGLSNTVYMTPGSNISEQARENSKTRDKIEILLGFHKSSF
jgi:hypothetical protein